MTESPRDRMARMFGLGKYGYVLADEILKAHQDNIEAWLVEQGWAAAADLLNTGFGQEEPLL